MYTVELNVIDKVSLAGATAITRVYVEVSRINAIVAGSAVRYHHHNHHHHHTNHHHHHHHHHHHQRGIKRSDPMVFDASPSYDEDKSPNMPKVSSSSSSSSTSSLQSLQSSSSKEPELCVELPATQAYH